MLVKNSLLIFPFKRNNSPIRDFKDCSRIFNGLNSFMKDNMNLIMIMIMHEFLISTLS